MTCNGSTTLCSALVWFCSFLLQAFLLARRNEYMSFQAVTPIVDAQSIPSPAFDPEKFNTKRTKICAYRVWSVCRHNIVAANWNSEGSVAANWNSECSCRSCRFTLAYNSSPTFSPSLSKAQICIDA
jgi:hypothetical protein